MQSKKFWIPVVLAFVTLAHAQLPYNRDRCAPGTPIPFESGGLWGYVTASGFTIPPHFNTSYQFYRRTALACTSEGCGLIDTKGKLLTPLQNRQTMNISGGEGLGVVERDRKWGYAEKSGKIVIPFQFDYAGAFEKGMAQVTLNGKGFFINHKGKRITPEFTGPLYDFTEDLAAAGMGDKIGFIRRDGSFAIPPKYQVSSGTAFSEGLAAVRIDGKVGFIDKTGSVVVKPAYDDAFYFSEGLAPVRIGSAWGYIDKSGRMVLPPKYQTGYVFNEGVAPALLSGGSKVGYIDHTGAFAIPQIFDDAMPFCAGLAHVEIFHGIGFVPNVFCHQDRLQGRKGLIDHSGKYIWRDPEERIWNGAACS
jgi:hypothetical protein